MPNAAFVRQKERLKVLVMSVISSVGVSQSSYSYSQVPPGISFNVAPSAEQHEQRVARHDQRLADALLAAGVDEETTEAIKSDLRATFEESFSESDGHPDHEAIKKKIDSVFAEYGLEASQFIGGPGAAGPGGPPPGGPPPGGPPPSSASSETEESNSVDSETAEYQTFLELLEGLAEQEMDSSQLAQLIVDALYGLDESA